MSERRIHAARITAALAIFSLGAHADVRDPTQPPIQWRADGSVTPLRAALTLTLTRIAGTRREALLNGVLVTIGDSIDGAVVVAIEHGRVRLRRDGSEWQLGLLAEDVKRPPTEGPSR